jgi:hypothetical protein
MIATSECLRSTYKSHRFVSDWGARFPNFLLAYRALRIRWIGAGVQDCLSSSLLTGHPLMTLWAWPRLGSVRKRTLDCSGTFCLRHPSPQQGTTHSRSCGKFTQPSAWHPQLCLPTLEFCQWLNVKSLWQTGLLLGMPWEWCHVALLAHQHEREVTQAPIPMRGPH